MSTASWIIGLLGLANAWLLLMVTQLLSWKKDTERRINVLESCKMTDERFRMIIREELQGFELRLIKEGRLDA